MYFRVQLQASGLHRSLYIVSLRMEEIEIQGSILSAVISLPSAGISFGMGRVGVRLDLRRAV